MSTFLTTRAPRPSSSPSTRLEEWGVRTVVLLTPGEVDAAAKRSVDYRRPEPDAS